MAENRYKTAREAADATERTPEESVQLTPELQKVYSHMTQREYGEIMPLDGSTQQETDRTEPENSDSRTQRLIDRILSALTE